MAVSLTLSVSPSSAITPGTVITATYAVAGNAPVPGAVVGTTSGEVTIAGQEYEAVTTISSISTPPAAVTYSAPVCSGLKFAQASQPSVFTATAGATFGTTVSGSVVVKGTTYSATAAISAAAPVTPPPPPPPSGTVPYPAALATGHALLNQYLPSDLLSWRFDPGTTTPVTNGSGITEDPGSPRNVSVTTDGGLSVLKLACTSAADCGVIQSPGTYPTASGVIEALVKFSGFTNASGHFFSAWSSFWLFNADWPAGGELDAVESQYGNSYVSYHYGSGTSSVATTDPWTYPAKTVQLAPENTSAVPVAPNILPDTWTYVTLAFGRNAAGNYQCEVFYNGVLYCTVSGEFVTGSPMLITAGTSFGGPVLGTAQAPFDQAASVEIQYVRVFS
jgi:hypothetical protein